MTSTKFMYIDDDSIEDLHRQIEQIVDNSSGRLVIELHNPMPMNQYLGILHANDYDGIIIDQKLDLPNNAQGTPYRADYFGAALAQNFRTHMAAKTDHMQQLPIVLMSNEKNLIDYYNPDESSHNLFDLVINKIQLRDAKCGEYFAKYMLSLSQSYKILSTEYKLENLLNCDKQTLSLLDPRFISYLESKNGDPYATTFAITSTLIKSAGILVTEEMLATKLGIDIEKSKSWDDIKELLISFKYQGVFSEIRERWWFTFIENWWETEIDKTTLKALTSYQRVDLLREKLSIQELCPLEPSYPNQSSKFWVNCVVSKKPLDPYDALRAESHDLKPWEQPKYLDIISVLETRALDAGFKIHPDDRYKREVLKQRLLPNV
ncbi:protein-PII uridylyltransferase [Rahnella bruchi]|uniref:protein-PII uridylyltransferase n=1 Tax=Rahnella bruchi TaxID=1510573 RepID=UPI000EA22DF3|nr:protein-PII uridylyltransferase [Rahnella bruchi]